MVNSQGRTRWNLRPDRSSIEAVGDGDCGGICSNAQAASERQNRDSNLIHIGSFAFDKENAGIELHDKIGRSPWQYDDLSAVQHRVEGWRSRGLVPRLSARWRG